MTRLVPLTLRDGTNFALNAHLVTSVADLPDGFVRIFTADEDYYDVPGTLAQISAIVSDPPAQAVRFVKLGDRYVNPALVAAVVDLNAPLTALMVHGREAEIYVPGSATEVIAKLEGRAP